MFCFLSQVKQKRYWLALSTGKLRNAPQRSVIVKTLLSVGIEAGSVLRLGTRVCQKIMLLIADKSWTNFYSQLLGFLTGEIGELQGLVQVIMSP